MSNTAVSRVDLQFTGLPHVIATAVLAGRGELALIDPGPTTCLPVLEAGLREQGHALEDVTHILLTHIHLDHATATGAIVSRQPKTRVLVHAKGAPHMADPAKLMASATRLYGDRMAELWGEFAPVPAHNITALTGGERLTVAGHEIEVAYTPGHASHHVSYFDRLTKTAFVGDTGGVQIDGGWVLPPTPPPDVDLEAWQSSVETIRAWKPDTLFLTHFGPTVLPPPAHLDVLMSHLGRMAEAVHLELVAEGSDEERLQRFADRVRNDFYREMRDSQVELYVRAIPFDHLWQGLTRYWRKRAVSN